MIFVILVLIMIMMMMMMMMMGLGRNERLLWSGVAGANRCTLPQPGRHNCQEHDEDDYDDGNYYEEINYDGDYEIAYTISAIIIMKMVTRIKREPTNSTTATVLVINTMRMILFLKVIIMVIKTIIIVLKMMIIKLASK